MNLIVSFLHILLALGVYFAFALLSVFVVRKAGANLAEMASRNSAFVLTVGAGANALILAVILLLVAALERMPIGVLGLRLGARDAIYVLCAAAATWFMATGFVRLLAAVGRISLHGESPAERPEADRSSGSVRQAVLAVTVLLVVALQEEVLFRGYAGFNLRYLGWAAVLALTTLIFVVVHFLTNRVSATQIGSWAAGGLMIGAVYIVSGSIWAAFAVHFVTDLVNVVVFNITGKLSLYHPDPPLGAGHRALFRVAQSVVLVALLLAIYGPVVHLSFLAGS